MKERLLFNRIALYSAHISPRHIEFAAFVEPYLADARLSLGDRAAVSAGVAAHPVAIDFLVQISLADVLIHEIAQGRHGEPLELF